MKETIYKVVYVCEYCRKGYDPMNARYFRNLESAKHIFNLIRPYINFNADEWVQLVELEVTTDENGEMHTTNDALLSVWSDSDKGGAEYWDKDFNPVRYEVMSI